MLYLKSSRGIVVMQKTFSDLDIQALVDGELSEEDEVKLRRYLKENKSAQNRYQELLDQKKLLQFWWAETRSYH